MAACHRWAGHVAKMDETRILRMLLFGELEQGTRHVGRPLKRYKDQLKAILKTGPADLLRKRCFQPPPPPPPTHTHTHTLSK